jgi:hypothetical protein
MTLPSTFERPLDLAWRASAATFGERISGGRFRAFAHQRYIAHRIALAVARGRGRLLITLPTRHGKSELVSRWVPTWFLDNLPDRHVILASYGAELSERYGREVRNEFDQNPALITRLRQDSQAANRWNTPQGGGMIATGVGGPILGFGANLAIVDDAHKDWNEAQSPRFRRRVQDWFCSTLYSRLEPGATVVVLMQRLHEDDLAGFLMEHHADPWEVIRLPALAEENDPMGRQPGEALCPQRYDVDALHRIRAGMTAQAWMAMYQQRPELLGSGRAYQRFDPAINEDKTLVLRGDLPLQLAFDFNLNPGSHVIVGQYDRRHDQFTAVHEIFGPRMKTPAAMEALAKLLKQYPQGQFGEVHVFGDASGDSESTKSTRPGETDYTIIVDRLRQMGLKPQLKVPSRNPPVRDRLATMNDALSDSAGEAHYKVHPLNCPRLVRDLKEVKEDEDGGIDKTNEDLTHPSDADSYRVFWQRPLQRLPTDTGRIAIAS